VRAQQSTHLLAGGYLSKTRQAREIDWLTASNGLADRYAREIDRLTASNGLADRYAREIDRMTASNGLADRNAREIDWLTASNGLADRYAVEIKDSCLAAIHRGLRISQYSCQFERVSDTICIINVESTSLSAS